MGQPVTVSVKRVYWDDIISASIEYHIQKLPAGIQNTLVVAAHKAHSVFCKIKT